MLLLGMLVGAVAGYFYWLEIGCTSGTCMITSRPLNTTIYGAFMGAVLGDMFRKKE